MPRKPAAMSWQGFAEHQIQEAMQSGQFDRLPGAGAPIGSVDAPLQDDWWLRQKLKDEQLSVLPPLLEARRDIEQTRTRLRLVRDETAVRREFEALRDRVWTAIRSPLPSPSVCVLPIDVDEEVTRWRMQQESPA